MGEGGSVVDEWSREPCGLTLEGIQVLAGSYCTLCATSLVFFVAYLAATHGRRQPPALRWSIIALTVGTSLCLPVAGPRVRDPTVVYTESWAVCVLFFVGDLLAHWGLLGVGSHIYGVASSRVFVLSPQRGALLASRLRRLCLAVGALQPLAIGGVVGSGLPGASPGTRQAGLQAFWIGQVSLIFGAVFSYELVPAARGVFRYHSELPEETPASMRREIRIVGTVLVLFSLGTLSNVPIGLASAFLPALYRNSGVVYCYYCLNFHLLVAVGCMAAEVYSWVARMRDQATRSSRPVRQCSTLSADDVIKALESGSSKGSSRSDGVSKSLSLGGTEPAWERGTTLEVLERLVQSWGGCEGMTTEQVCHQCVMPATSGAGCSLWAALKASCAKDLETCTMLAHLSKPTVFVSHCWRSQFLDIISILRNYNKNSQRDNLFFFDVVSMNQHDLASGVKASIMLDSLQRSIATSGRVLMAMTPHQQPLLLTRAWCLYEMHVAYTMKVKMTCGFTEEAEAEVLENLRKDQQFLQSLLDAVDSGKATATLESDKVMILGRIEKTGIEQFNKFIRTRLRSTLSLLMSGMSADS